MKRISDAQRFSILVNDLSKCVVCQTSYNINLHEIFFGKNRQNSKNYGLVIPLCVNHHTGRSGIHFNKELDLRWKRIAQEKFNQTYLEEDFLTIFYKNYL